MLPAASSVHVVCCLRSDSEAIQKHVDDLRSISIHSHCFHALASKLRAPPNDRLCRRAPAMSNISKPLTQGGEDA